MQTTFLSQQCFVPRQFSAPERDRELALVIFDSHAQSKISAGEMTMKSCPSTLRLTVHVLTYFRTSKGSIFPVATVSARRNGFGEVSHYHFLICFAALVQTLRLSSASVSLSSSVPRDIRKTFWPVSFLAPHASVFGGFPFGMAADFGQIVTKLDGM